MPRVSCLVSLADGIVLTRPTRAHSACHMLVFLVCLCFFSYVQSPICCLAFLCTAGSMRCVCVCWGVRIAMQVRVWDVERQEV